MSFWLTLLVCALATPLSAQNWATRDLCLIDEAKIHQDIFTPDFHAAMQTRAGQIPNGIGRYWRITAPDGATSHLWGTMHSSLPLILRLPDEVERTIKSARIVATETDYTQQTRADLIRAYTSFDRYRDAEQISVQQMELPEKLLTWTRDRLVGLGWGEEAFDYLSPAAVVELMLGDPCGDFNSGIYPIQDDRIQMLGEIAGAQVLSLEEPRALFKKLNNDSNLGLTRAMIAVYANYLNPDITREALSTSYALYLQGRIAEMMAWDETYFADTYPDEGLAWLARTNDYLLRERNEGFIETAMTDLRQGGVFMAVGTYHLPKDYGLIEMLREAGFTVTRVPLQGEPSE
ncbi:MAG: TraB/GumN family protein [Pseudomonadota bacterium]